MIASVVTRLERLSVTSLSLPSFQRFFFPHTTLLFSGEYVAGIVGYLGYR